jgi:hypothetical protein
MTIHHHLVVRLRIHGAILYLPTRLRAVQLIRDRDNFFLTLDWSISSVAVLKGVNEM